MSFPTNKGILSILNAAIVGQEEAKERLVVSLYNHFYAIAQSGKSDPKPNALIMGPTGSGKTFLLETLAEALELAIKQVNSARFVPAGYKGMLLSDIFSQLVEECGGNLERAEHAIVVLDEIDKRKFRNSAYEDIGQMLQQELLKPLVSDSVSGVNTTNILFVGTGAFVGLTDIVRKRINNSNLSENEALAQVAPSDFQDFGMAPEFVGRFPIRLYVKKLSREDFLTIIRSTKKSFLKQKQRLFEEHGFELHITDDALGAMADRAYEQGLGVRALQSVVADACDGVQAHFEDFFAQGNRRIEITKEVILGTQKPRALPSNKFSPDKSRNVRKNLDALFERLKPAGENKHTKPEQKTQEPVTQNPTEDIFQPLQSVIPDTTPKNMIDSATSQPLIQTPITPPGPLNPTLGAFSVLPDSSLGYLTESERRDLQQMVNEYRNPRSTTWSRLRGAFSGFSRARLPKFWGSKGSNPPLLRNILLALFLALVSYVAVVLAAYRDELRSGASSFRLLLCREEFGDWHSLGLLAAVLVFSFCRYHKENRELASVFQCYAGITVYSAIITLGSRVEIFSFRHAILSYARFLDHALWRTGYVTWWNFLAAAVGAAIILWQLRPRVEGPHGPRVWRYLTGRGPYESAN